jgi:hypothetical protein
MNRIILPAESVTSLITDLRRSSNSPRNLAPAWLIIYAQIDYIRTRSGWHRLHTGIFCVELSRLSLRNIVSIFGIMGVQVLSMDDKSYCEADTGARYDLIGQTDMHLTQTLRTIKRVEAVAQRCGYQQKEVTHARTRAHTHTHTCDEGAHVQAHQKPALQSLGHVVGHNALCQPLCHCCLHTQQCKQQSISVRNKCSPKSKSQTTYAAVQTATYQCQKHMYTKKQQSNYIRSSANSNVLVSETNVHLKARFKLHTQ